MQNDELLVKKEEIQTIISKMRTPIQITLSK
jgi:hypothetical protein